MPQPKGQRLLVVRNDKLGDFMLAWPALACLKQAHPDNHVSVLVPHYTAALARACPWVDEVLVDPGDDASRDVQRALLAQLRAGRFDALLTLFSTPRIGWLGWRAGIALRLAPATKWAQVFHNRRIVQRRSRSQRPEYRYNLELAEALLTQLGQPIPILEPPYWPLPTTMRGEQRQRLARECGLDARRRWGFVHGGSGGSAVNLSPAHYAALVASIDVRLDTPAEWVLTSGPGEHAAAAALCDDLVDQGVATRVMPPRDDLVDFAHSLSAADLLIAGSTGPLHIAGCLDVPTVGFYPAKRSATPLRWQTCNRDAHRLAFSPPAAEHATDMSRIDIEAAAQAIADWWPAPTASPMPATGSR
ncbi:glycosyltransferase family 9 protein [Halomonas sp. IOP_31]|uniref:glycosyltransferase family 9 protein n=1 Tax=Halomonas sp. IOP_31 TaxID=2876584 RepID=UPI001E5F9E39|nr:glycosyltransferase family 9 protein [Halomonas sp. IOP_31]MCD6007420.1 glycosyltransferase family 9 protein [Halomonas sp. IOP_31]